MTAIQWDVIDTEAEAGAVTVFSGGACCIRDAAGVLLRNTERDSINNWLTEQDIAFYDPQIHPETHGTEYVYEIHHKLEMAARAAAQVTLYEISPRTFGGVTAMEIAMDEYRTTHPTVIFFSDGNGDKDIIPMHSGNGYPLFAPFGIKDNATAQQAHYREFVKNANRMRQYLIRMAQEMPALTVTFNEIAFKGDRVITPDRMHAVDIFEALVDASAGERVIVTFTGGDKAVNSKGVPVFRVPDKPRPVEQSALLDQYVDEGNALREAISRLVRINVYTRVVYTQRSVVNALTDFLQLRGVV